jgi:hypothetical protein
VNKHEFVVGDFFKHKNKSKEEVNKKTNEGRYNEDKNQSAIQKFASSSSFPFPFVPLQRRRCLVAPWFV